jgi:hypothetical protein
MLGGSRAFSEGAYAGTPVADALPVVLEPQPQLGPNEQPPSAWLKVRPTRAGQGHPVTRIAATEAASVERWDDLPPVSSTNPIRAVKPGATVLLEGEDPRGREQIVLASQRYGRGKAIALALQATWPWQLDAKMPVEDQTHENFWRQLLRWLVDGVPDIVEARAAADRVEPGETVDLTAEVVDRAFVELNDAKVTAHVTRPDGSTVEVPLQWTGERNGEYKATFVAGERGRYETRIEATRGGEPIGASVVHVLAAPSDAEYFDPAMHAALLRRIAEETGGRFYTPETAGALAEDLRYTGRGVTTVEERELWHMPIVLLFLAGLVCGEWGYRRYAGLA